MAVYIRVRLRKPRFNVARLTRLGRRILSAARESGADMSLELIGDGRMRKLNRFYRKNDRTTDVLAFAMREAVVPRVAARAPYMLGDVLISVPTARRQAEAAGRSLDEELAALLVHGVLHLCGYDHERSEKEAIRMRRRERAILSRLRPVPSLSMRHVEGNVRKQ